MHSPFPSPTKRKTRTRKLMGQRTTTMIRRNRLATVQRCYRHATLQRGPRERKRSQEGRVANPKRRRDSLRANAQICIKRKRKRRRPVRRQKGRSKRDLSPEATQRRRANAILKCQGTASRESARVKREKRTTLVPLTRRSLATQATREHT